MNLEGLFSNRPVLWWINETGIIIEVLGAVIIVAAAFRSRNAIKDIQHTFGADLPVVLRDVIASQAFTELKGFGLLALGLVMQFVGGF